MSIKQRFIWFLTCAVLFPFTGLAQTKSENIMKLMDLTKPDSVIFVNLSRSLPAMVTHVQKEQNDTLLRPELSAYAKMELGNSLHAFKQKEMVDAYDSRFSEEEIKQLVGFFSTSAGKKWNSYGFDIMREMMRASAKIVTTDIKDKLTSKVKEIMKAEKTKE